MSWFRGKKEEPKEPEISFGDTTGFAADTSDFSTPQPGPQQTMASGAGFQREIMAVQQQAMIQQIVGQLTTEAFEACMDKPSTSLSSREQDCIASTVHKWLDTSEFVMGRLQRGQK